MSESTWVSSGALALAALVGLFSGCGESASPGADQVFLNGVVYTVDDDHSVAEAVGIRDGEIIFVGADAEADAFIGMNTRVIDLDGRMLMPGFHDAHAHVRYGGTASLGCDLQDGTDPSEIRSLLLECAQSGEYGPDEWVVGGGWALAAFPGGSPTAAMLDEIFDGRPVFLSDAFGHNTWVSSRALEIAGIDSTTPDPPNGVIVRDPATGKPVGTLRDSAMGLVESVMPELSESQRYEGLRAGLQAANRFGITAFIEPGVSEDNLSLYATAEENGDLTARVVASLSPIDELPGKVGPELFELLAVRDRYRGRYLDVDSVKIYIDGVIETRTSYMLEPYLDGTNFSPFYAQRELDRLYSELDAMGLQIHTHAIGDAAIRLALDAYERALLSNGPNDNRHHIVHLQLIDDDDISRFAELNVAANFQGLWCYPDVYIEIAEDIVGADRTQAFYPLRSVMEAGGLLVGGSDWDVSSLNPLDAIETVVRRQDPFAATGPMLGKDQTIELGSAIDMYTRNAAYIMRLEDQTGSIEVGKRADLIVLDRDLFAVPAVEINEARVLLTMMDGRIVFVAEDAGLRTQE